MQLGLRRPIYRIRSARVGFANEKTELTGFDIVDANLMLEMRGTFTADPTQPPSAGQINSMVIVEFIDGEIGAELASNRELSIEGLISRILLISTPLKKKKKKKSMVKVENQSSETAETQTQSLGTVKKSLVVKTTLTLKTSASV